MNLLAKVSRLAISPLPGPTAWYAIPLRLIVGFGFLQHGYAKLARASVEIVAGPGGRYECAGAHYD